MEELLKGDPEILLEIITEKLPNSIWVVPADLKENVSRISSAVSMQRGFAPEEVLEQGFEDIFTEQSLAVVFSTINEEKTLEEGPNVDKDRIRILELEMKCKDGSTIWTENQISFLHDDAGKLVAFLGITKDISDKKLAIERQELSIRILECLNNGDEDVKIIIDKIITIIRENLKISSVSFRLLDDEENYSHFVSQGFPEEFLKKTNSPCVDCSAVGCLCGAVIEERLDEKFLLKTDHGSMWTGSLGDLRDYLRTKHFQVKSECIDSGYESLALIPIKTREKVVGLMQMASTRNDVFSKEMIKFFERIVTSIGLAIERNKTRQELKDREDQLRHAQRLESVGRLAGGVAHDFNNLLVVISGYVDFLIENSETSDKQEKDLTMIKKAADRAEKLVRQLLAFGRKQVLIKKVVDVNETFIEFQKMLLSLIEENITLQFSPAENLHAIEADKSQLEQIIMNLILNSRDAMSHGGILTVSTQNVEIKKDRMIDSEILKAGRYVSIKVSDNGMGIPEEVLNSIFEPFFTTKPVCEGSGLGLSVVHGIVRQHEGHIFVESKVDEGTTIEVLFPASEKNMQTEVRKVNEKAEKMLEGKKILLIEDEALVQKVVSRVLAKFGATVSTALTSKEAYEKYKEGNGEFDMIFSDVTLPDGNGVDLVMDFRKQGYEGALLLTSGYPFDSKVQNLTEGEDIPFVQKPFVSRELIQKISSLIKDSE